ncbi:MAG: substrate-binding domain-containing protein [Spirirestis rafaelensis WJT71-NPBG6]|nr:substrate-binding domain-containing protein [Spirirestis rafaelensis WJT71-NPBG6]
MWQKEKQDSSIVSLALLLALTSPAGTLFAPNCVQAQSATENPSFPLPQTVENGTKVRIDGSSRMTPINQSLKESFEKQFSGTSVELAANGTDSALKALQDGKIDIATIARGLTPEEKAQGLEQLRVRREKIAIVVGASNPFKRSLTSKQFARIFRGEITDWSELGGPSGKIRLIDRPSTSDTRESLRSYPAFKTNKFATGSTATQLADDNTAEVVKQLGKDGISYVLANEISKLEDVRVLKLHNTSPDDARYPFSQPFVYVYKKNPSLGLAGFLGFASAKPGIQAIEQARTAEANAIAASVLQTIPPNPIVSAASVPGVATSPATEPAAIAATSPSTDANNFTTANQNNSASDRLSVPATGNIETAPNERISPWLWLLTLPVIGGLLLWLLGKRRAKPQSTDDVIESSNQPLEEATPTAAIGASVAPPVSDALSDNQLLRAYAQTQSGAVENTTDMPSNLPQGVTNTGANVPEETMLPVSNIASGGSAALGGVAAEVGTSIWSPPSDNQTNIEAADETTEIINNTELSSNVPQVVSDVEPPVTEIPTDQQPDVPIPTAEAQPPVQSNLGEDVTSTGGTVAGGGSILWSRLTGSSQPEALIESTQNDDLEEDVWDIETPATEVTIPKLQYFTTVDATSTEVRDSFPVASNLEAPTTEITASVPEQPDVSIVETPTTELTNSLFVASNLEAPEAQIPIASDLNIEAPTTEVRNSVSLASNPEASIIEITPAEAQIPTVTSDEDVETTEITASFPEQPHVPELVSDEDVETSTTEITASFPELASDEDDWDMEFAADETEVQPPAQFNWLQNITSAGGAVAAGSGAVLWSRLQNKASQPEASTDPTQINDDLEDDFWDIETPPTESPDVPEVASNNVEAPSSTQVTDSVLESPDVPELAFNNVEAPSSTQVTDSVLESPDVPELAFNNVEAPSSIQVTDSVPEFADVPELASDEDDWDIEFAADQTEEQPPAQSNWLENITSAGSAVIGSGAVLWSRLSGKGSQPEASNDTTENSDIDEEFWDIETPVTQQPDVPQTVNALLPTVQILPAISQLPDVSQTVNAQLPTVEITPAISQLPDFPQTVNAQLPTVEIIPAISQLPNVREADLDVVADAAEDDLSAESNWLENITSADDATIEEDAVSSDLFDMDETTSLNSPESSEISAEVTDATLEQPANNLPIVKDMDETVSNMSEDMTENVTEPSPLDLTAGVPFIGAGAGGGAWHQSYDLSKNTDDNVNGDTNNEEKDVESSIAIAPRTAKWAYVSWNVTSTQKKAVQQEGVCQLALRLYDVTGIDLSYQPPTLVQQYECEEITHDRYVAIPVSDRDYIAEIGYLINGDRWFLLARSATVRIHNRPQPDFWFQADVELIIHGSTEPGATVKIADHSIKVKPDGTFHLRVPFTDSLIDYLMTAVTTDGQQTRIIHKKFFQETQE